MVTIELRFLGGRFHATPWGRHVNEGVPEWPPSPFRLLRALYDTWRRKAPEASREQIESLLGLLASTAPDFDLPRAGASHVRLFLRQGSENDADKSLVFDPFVIVLPSDPVRIGWPHVELSGQQRKLLEDLLVRLSYLGRAESLVDARLSCDPVAASWNCRPVERDEQIADLVSQRHEIVEVACVAVPGTHLLPERKHGNGRERPLGWLDALTWGSAEVLAHKLSNPPALQWVSYRRSQEALEFPPTRQDKAKKPGVDSMLLGLHGTVLPRVADTVVIAERFRARVLAESRKIGGGDPGSVPSLLRGKDSWNIPLRGHRHAYYLPLDRDEDGRIDHVLVRCAGGLGGKEQLAISRAHYLWQAKGRPGIQVVLVASGQMTELLEVNRCWRSATPFIPPRHYKPKDGEFDTWLEGELRRALAQHDLPTPLEIEPLARLELPRTTRVCRWGEFIRSRKEDPPRPGFGFRISFAESVSGPFAVGYGAHFGLGQFVPIELPKREAGG